MGEVIGLPKANLGKPANGSTLGSPPHLLGEFFSELELMSSICHPGVWLRQSRTFWEGKSSSWPILLPYIQQGKMRPFVVAVAARQLELARVPTLIEIGLDAFPLKPCKSFEAPSQ